MTEIVVNHLTRMQSPRICFAGIDVATSTHVRPVTDRETPLTRELLVENEGPLALGAVVDLGVVQALHRRPEAEDVDFLPRHARCVRQLDGDEYMATIDRVGEASLEDAFGPVRSAEAGSTRSTRARENDPSPA